MSKVKGEQENSNERASESLQAQLLHLRQPDLPEPLVYSISRLSHWFWQDYISQDLRAQHLIIQGQQLTPAFPTFLGELFYRLFTEPYPPLIRSRSPDHRWAKTLQDHLTHLNYSLTFEDLIADTQADPVSAGLATVELGEHCLTVLPQLLRSTQSRTQNSAGSPSTPSSSSGGSSPSPLQRSLQSACERTHQTVQQTRSLMRSFQAGWDAAQGLERQGTFRDKLALAQTLQKNAYMRRIAELAGRMQQTMRIQQRSKAQQGYSQLTGLEIGNDLGRIFPSELIKLADQDLFPLFAKGYLERTLLQYQKEDRESLQQGPIVICVDVSGSMQGDPDLWAKAVALTLAQLAGQQQRHCRVIQFSEAVKRVDDLPPDRPLVETILQVLGQFFSGGGTNFMEPLEMALEAIEDQPQLRQADLIFITDGIGHLHQDFLQRFYHSQEKHEFSVYGVMIGAQPSPQGIAVLGQFCDQIWQVSHLDSNGSEIKELFAL